MPNGSQLIPQVVWRRNLWVGLVAVFCLVAGQTMVFVLVPLAAIEMGARATLIGVLVSLPGAIGLVSDIPIAITADTVGRRRLMIIGGLVGVLAAGILAASTSLCWLFLGVTVYGFSLSLAFGPTLAFISQAVAHRHGGRAQGYNGSAQAFGALSGAFVAGYLVQQEGLATAFATAAILAAAMFATTLCGIEAGGPPDRARLSLRLMVSGYRKVGYLLRTRALLRMSAIASSIHALVFHVIGHSFLGLYLVSELGYPPLLAGTLLAARNLTTSVISPSFGAVNALMGPLRPALLLSLIAASTLLVTPLAATPILVACLLLVQGAGTAFGVAAANVFVTSGVSARERTLGFCCPLLASRISMFLLPIGLGWGLEVAGFASVFVAAGALTLVALAALGQTGRHFSML